MAVDLGFGASKSCGLAWQIPDGERQTKVVSFGECVKHVAKFVSKNSDSALIVEAPLSGLFDPVGNPKGRLPFERVNAGGRTGMRYWYVGAGAAVGLGAVFLFSQLSQSTTPESNVVNVIEGFVSFKVRRSDHKEDALALLNALHEPSTTRFHTVKAEAGEQCVNLLSLAGLASQEDPCPVITVVDV